MARWHHLFSLGLFIFFFLMIRRPPTPTLFPSPTLSRPLTAEQVPDPPAAPACSGKTSRAVRARLNAAAAAVFFMASLPCKRTFRAPAEDPSCAGTVLPAYNSVHAR